MADLCGYASRPLAFIFRYVRLRPFSHAVILAAVLGAVACSVSTQYGVKYLVDVLSSGAERRRVAGIPAAGSLIAADNLLWRVAGWIASFAFVGVTGDLRRDLFRHLTGHSPSYFADRLPGHADQPRHRDVECGLHGREHVRLERAAALRGDGGGDRARAHRQPADGRRARTSSPASWWSIMFRLAARRAAAASRFRRQGGHGRRRNGRRDQQHVAGAGLRRLRPRASPLRRDRRPRDERAPAQPALPREAAHLACGGHHRADDRPAGLGDRRSGSAATPPPATSCSPARWDCRCCMPRAISRWRWST